MHSFTTKLLFLSQKNYRNHNLNYYWSFWNVGIVSKLDLRFFHKYQVSKKLDAEQVEAVFARFDLNGDGRLSMEEFKLLMEKR